MVADYGSTTRVIITCTILLSYLCETTGPESDCNAEFHKQILRLFMKQNKVEYDTCDDFPFEAISDFSTFNNRQSDKMGKDIKRLLEMPLADMFCVLSRLRNQETEGTLTYVEMVTRAVMIQRPETRVFCLPPPHQTQPCTFFDEHKFTTNANAAESGRDTEHCTSRDPEKRLGWWREDPGLSEHHGSWHVVYPFSEPNHDRQGELFAYMHEQMLARYDFERLALGLERVRAYGPGYGWDEPLAEGYNPRMSHYSFRPANLRMANLTRLDGAGEYKVMKDTIQRHIDSIFNGLARGYFESHQGKTLNITMDLLGNTAESNMGSANHTLYGSVHNIGHMLLALMNDPERMYDIKMGPMWNTWTAARDPIFFRWHKFIDAMFETYRANQTSYLKKDLLFPNIEMTHIEVQTDGTPSPKTNRLYTYMELVKFNVYNAASQDSDELKPLSIYQQQLNYKPFHYKFTVKNSGNNRAFVVFRVFVAPKSSTKLEDWRNMFVEMDRFVQEVEPGVTTVSRSDVDSSVVLRPQPTVEQILQGKVDCRAGPECGCGWPKHLLVPRGTEAGMSADLYVLATDWEQDRVDYNTTMSGGSVSYCGKKGGMYPDKRAMGFPFDRTMGYDTVKDMVRDVPNSAIIPVKIVYQKEDHVKDEDTEARSCKPSSPDTKSSYIIV